MRRIFLVFLVVSGFAQSIAAQVAGDSVIAPATIAGPVDSITMADNTLSRGDTLPLISRDSVSERPWPLADPFDTSLSLVQQVLRHHPYFGFASKPGVIHTDLKRFQGKEKLFYAMIGMLLAFAFLRQAFPKYFNDLFRLLFRTTLKQKQIREQLMQNPLPSLLLNIYFVIAGGYYAGILLRHFERSPVGNPWLLFFYCAAGLAVIYLLKFAGIKVLGWLLNLREAGDSYIFIVFLINKVIGIFLLPFLVLLSFMQGSAYTVALVLSWCGLGILYGYRFLLIYASLRNQVRFNPFHFLLYLAAFEVAPLLLIYKALLFFFA